MYLFDFFVNRHREELEAPVWLTVGIKQGRSGRPALGYWRQVVGKLWSDCIRLAVSCTSFDVVVCARKFS